GSGGGSAPIHFGDTEKHQQKEEAAVSNNGAKSGAKKSAKPAKKAAIARKAGREQWLPKGRPKSLFSMRSSRRCLRRWNAIRPLCCSVKTLAFSAVRSRRVKACLRDLAGSA